MIPYSLTHSKETLATHFKESDQGDFLFLIFCTNNKYIAQIYTKGNDEIIK